MSQYTIAAVSCGKDSIVIPHECIRRGQRLDEVVMYDTGMEFQAIYDTWAELTKVLDACRRAPQHRYLFLTKNPARYAELDHMALLPHENNFWYGHTVANEEALATYATTGANVNTFWSMEPLPEPPMEVDHETD